MKKFLIVGLTLFMFFFKNTTLADYDKVFYDLKIKSISGKNINFSEYRDKVVLVAVSYTHLRAHET